MTLDLANIDVLRAQPGDILWFNLRADTEPSEAREFAETLVSSGIIPKGVMPLITFDDVVSSARVSTVDDIRNYRDSLDGIIAEWQLDEEYGEDD